MVANGEMEAVLDLLRRARTGVVALSIARGTGLSTLVVIPVLSRLVDEGLALRRVVTEPDGSHRTWEYQLTARARRWLHTTDATAAAPNGSA
ncbi:hypothetical protein BH20ACT3_BH20ACT3_05050 [soil metagenome]